MIADLFEAHEKRQDKAFALNAFRVSSCWASSFDRLLVKRRLRRLSGQNAFISVLSGRSAITALSVFRRRKI